MTISETIFLFFSFLAGLLSLLFFIRRKGDRFANTLLGIYLALFSYNIFYNVLYWAEKFYESGLIHFVGTNQIVWLLYGPILYLYLKRVVKNSSITWQDSIHFIPALFVVLNFSSFFILSTPEKIEVVTTYQMPKYFLVFIPNFVFITIGLQLLYFLIMQWILKRDITSVIRRNWLNWLSYSYLGYCLSFASYFVLLRLGIVHIGYDYFIGFSMLFFIGLVVYFGFLQSQVFDGVGVHKLLGIEKYKKTGLTKSHSLELRNILSTYMEEEKPYLNSELNLESLAEDLNLSRHHMSQVINEHFDAHFFDFINGYRIEEAKRLLQQSPHLQVADVLYQCGFNNRVSFNKAFKRHTGKTPTQYKKNGKISSANL